MNVREEISIIKDRILLNSPLDKKYFIFVNKGYVINLF